MGILPYNYSNPNYNSINDPGFELRRQLQTRQAQLDKINSHEVLSEDQVKKKQDLEKTVSLLQGKLDKYTNRGQPPQVAKSNSIGTSAVSSTAVTQKAIISDNEKSFSEGKVIAKNQYNKAQLSNSSHSNPVAANNNYLKGFFFDAKI